MPKLRIRRNARRFLAMWRFAHSQHFLAAKARDFAPFTRVTLIATAIILLSAVFWDDALDPAHGFSNLGLRGLQCALVLCWALLSGRNPRNVGARIAALTVPAVVEALFMVCLTRLTGGFSYGIGGFVYFFSFMSFLLIPQSLRLSLCGFTIVAVLPLLLREIPIFEVLNPRIYIAYIVLILVPVIPMRIFFDYLYWRIYSHRSEIETQALTDPLSGLPNRRNFLNISTDSLVWHTRHSHPASLMFIDIDRFKPINDTYGHRAGDIAIKHVGQLINEYSRERDLVARYGGEEFLVWLPETDVHDAERVAERIRSEIAATPIPLSQDNNRSLYLTVSIGIAVCRPLQFSFADIDDMIHAADEAVYAAKSAGRNRVLVNIATPTTETGSARA